MSPTQNAESQARADDDTQRSVLSLGSRHHGYRDVQKFENFREAIKVDVPFESRPTQFFQLARPGDDSDVRWRMSTSWRAMQSEKCRHSRAAS